MDKLNEKVEEILEKYVRPELALHQGNIRLQEVRDGVAYVKLMGHCSGCPSAKYTLESIVKEEVLKHTNEIKDVRLQEEVSQELYDFAKKILQEHRS